MSVMTLQSICASALINNVTVSASLEEIRNSFLSRKGALVNLTADSKLITKAESFVGSILQAFPNSLTSETGTWNTCLEPLNEGLIVPTQVSYRVIP